MHIRVSSSHRWKRGDFRTSLTQGRKTDVALQGDSSRTTMPPKRVQSHVLSDEGLNFRRLEAALATGVEADKKYDRENDAKFRAVAQKVATFDEFEGIVKAAHLKPMTEDVTKLELPRSSWNASGRAKGRNIRRAGDAPSQTVDLTVAAESTQAFLRCWRCKTCSAKQRYDYLVQVTGPGLASTLLKTECESLLGEVLETLNEGFSPDDADGVCAILTAFSAFNRFDLSKDFLEDRQATAALQLLDKVAQGDDQSVRTDTVSQLRVKYTR